MFKETCSLVCAFGIIALFSEGSGIWSAQVNGSREICGKGSWTLLRILGHAFFFFCCEASYCTATRMWVKMRCASRKLRRGGDLLLRKVYIGEAYICREERDTTICFPLPPKAAFHFRKATHVSHFWLREAASQAVRLHFLTFLMKVMEFSVEMGFSPWHVQLGRHDSLVLNRFNGGGVAGIL